MVRNVICYILRNGSVEASVAAEQLWRSRLHFIGNGFALTKNKNARNGTNAEEDKERNKQDGNCFLTQSSFPLKLKIDKRIEAAACKAHNTKNI